VDYFFNNLANDVSGAWWSYLIVFAFAALDVLIPLVPSETVLITGGVLAGAGDMRLSLLIPAAALGAILGDNIAYLLGRYFEEPLRRRFFSGEKAKERFAWAERQVARRGGELIVIGRFIPGGRTVVTVACGTLQLPWRRFIVWDVIAGVLWATYGALLGYFGGKTFEGSPWKGFIVAFGIALLVTGGIEAVRWVLRRRKAGGLTAAER
jgi:membrane protein DedA with SNARE-associated domain